MRGKGSGACLPHVGVPDGSTLELENVTLNVLHTPGHRPEHPCLLGRDYIGFDEPRLMPRESPPRPPRADDIRSRKMGLTSGAPSI